MADYDAFTYITNLGPSGLPDTFYRSTNYAEEAFRAAIAAFNGMADAGVDVIANLGDQSCSLVSPTYQGTGFVNPGRPGEFNTILAQITGNTFPELPSAPSQSEIAPAADRTPPIFTAVRPSVTDPQKPAVFSKAAPGEATLKTPTLPSDPDASIPAAPELAQFRIPTLPTIIRRTFSPQALPAAPEANVASFSFTEPGYSSALLDALKANLLQWLSGASTGLSDAVWNAIWNRAREREEVLYEKAEDEAVRSIAARGFSLPPGALSISLRRAREENLQRVSSLTREQAIEQAKMEVDNVRHAIVHGLQLEIQLETHANQIAQRAWETAKYTVEASISVLNALIALHNLRVVELKTFAEVFDIELRLELSKLEEARLELEAQKMIGELNTQLLEQYRLRVQAVREVWEIFSKRLERARFTLEENAQALEKQKISVQAYAEESRANATQWEAYSSQWKGEEIKANVFGIEADAFGKEVQAFTGLVDADAKKKGIEIDLQRIANENYLARVEGVKSLIQGISSKVDALSKALDALSRVYSTDVTAEVSKEDAATKRYSTDIERYRADADVCVSQARVATDAAVAAARLAGDKAIAAARVAGQVAAAALAQHNFSNSTSQSDSKSASVAVAQSQSSSFSTSHNHNYNYTKD